MRIARVIPLLRLPRGVHFFDYAIPEELRHIAVGALIRIPFRSKTIDGIVCDVQEKRSSPFALKKILAVRQEKALLPPYWKKFLDAIEADMGVPPPTTLRSFLTIGKRETDTPLRHSIVGKRYDTLRIPKNSLAAIEHIAKKPKGQKLFLWHKNEERIVAYLKYIETTIKKGSVLILFPQWSELEAFMEYLPKKYAERLITIASTLSLAERRSVWQHIATSQKCIIIGTRFAIFTPIQDLAGIILDHEHAYGWKEEQSPRYDTRRYIELLQKITNVPLLFSSPAPTIERRFHLASTTIETPSFQEPNTIITDLRESFATEHPYITETLRKAIEGCAPNDRIILLHNRTGHASSLVCKDCGTVVLCNDCRLPFTHHKDADKNDILRCHHCFKTMAVPLTCSNCRGSNLSTHGKGNERIAEEIKRLFPTHTNITIQTYPNILLLLWEKENPIKILAFIDALSPLSIPDFKTLDDLFALYRVAKTITAAQKAVLIIQTFSPEHAIFNDTAFTQRELEERKTMRYPPFTRLIKCIAKDTESAKAKKRLEELTLPGIDLSTVFPSHPPKQGAYYYWYRLVRVPSENSLTPIIQKIPSDILLDIDPETLL